MKKIYRFFYFIQIVIIMLFWYLRQCMWFLMATSIINDSSYNIFTITRLLCYYKIGEYVL